MLEGLTNAYIEKNGLKLIKNFLGCYPADINLKTKKKNFSVIFNLSNHNETGTHFVAISCNKDVIIYFDSFGNPCTNKHLKLFLEKNCRNKKLIYNKTKVQSDKSTFCGIFCLGFLLSQQNNITLNNFLKIFHPTNLPVNDQIILEFFKKIKQ